MTNLLTLELSQQLARERREIVPVDGIEAPRSAVTLCARLEMETDPDRRAAIYNLIEIECLLAGTFAAQLKFATDYHREFADALSQMAYGRALVRDGKHEEGLAQSRAVLDQAIATRTYINDAAANHMRTAIATASPDAVKVALAEMVESTRKPREKDSLPDLAWIDEAADLGGDPAVLDWLRMIEARNNKAAGFSTPEFRARLKRERREMAELDGFVVPRSAVTWHALLAVETDAEIRRDIHMNLAIECSIARQPAAQVKFAREAYEEFKDPLSLSGYAAALIEAGQVETGLAHARKALDLAIEQRKFINVCAGSYLRQAIETGSVAALQDALEALIDSLDLPRETDSALWTEFTFAWIDQAAAMGADPETVAWLREVVTSGQAHATAQGDG